MRRRPKHQIPTKYILLSMTALCILAMYVSFSLNLGGGPLNSIAGAILNRCRKESIMLVHGFLTKQII